MLLAASASRTRWRSCGFWRPLGSSGGAAVAPVPPRTAEEEDGEPVALSLTESGGGYSFCCPFESGEGAGEERAYGGGLAAAVWLQMR